MEFAISRPSLKEILKVESYTIYKNYFQMHHRSKYERLNKDEKGSYRQ